jgi:hypothetical protein
MVVTELFQHSPAETIKHVSYPAGWGHYTVVAIPPSGKR